MKASVTRIEDEEPAAAAKVEKAKATELSKSEALPPAKKEAPPQGETTQKAEKTEETKAPIVVKPPASAGPSFGSVSPIMPGGGDAIVVTVPPSQ